jgi:hypothetical protein
MPVSTDEHQARRLRGRFRSPRLLLAAALALVVISGGKSLASDCGEEDEDGDKWSIYRSCNKQFIEDRRICRKVKRASCWKSQNDRLAYCNKNKGEIGFPPLETH